MQPTTELKPLSQQVEVQQNQSIEGQKPVSQRSKPQHEPKKKKRVHLSFQSEEQQQSNQPEFKILKNPTINKENHLDKPSESRKSSTTSNLEEVIKAEYIKKIEKLKDQLIQLQYSYWEGGQLIKKLRRKKKEKVKDLLQVCRLQLVSSFKSLAQLIADDLLLVIKDFIIPHEIALYQIQALQLKSKKNEPLLNLRNVIVKKQGKELTLSVNINDPIRIIEKARYEKNKQAFPFCNWQILKIANK